MQTISPPEAQGRAGQLVWFLQNDDHPFIDADASALCEGLSALQADPAPYKSLWPSHWSFALATAARFHAPRNRPYVRYMLSGLKQIADSVPDIDPALHRAAMSAKSVRDFDDLVTARLAGYANSADYYAGTSVHHRLQDAPIPVLLLQGSNDPWVPSQPALDQPLAKGAPGSGVQVVVTRGGGHVGFHDSRLNWHIRATLAWCDAVAAAD